MAKLFNYVIASSIVMLSITSLMTNARRESPWQRTLDAMSKDEEQKLKKALKRLTKKEYEAVVKLLAAEKSAEQMKELQQKLDAIRAADDEAQK